MRSFLSFRGLNDAWLDRNAGRLALVLMTLLWSGAGSLHSQTPPDERKTLRAPVHSLSFQAGRALAGGGSVLDTNADLKFLENSINARLLYNPILTPAIEQAGPIYRIPAVRVRSNQYAIEYRKRGAGIKYLDLQGALDIPDTFINLPGLPPEYNVPPVPYYAQVTRSTTDRKLLASVIEVDLNLYYTFADFDLSEDRPPAELYGKLSAGVGRGWLGPGSGPRLEEAHAGVGLGLRYHVSPNIFLFPEATFQYYAIRTAYSDPLNRTKTLVNPRSGDVYLGRLNFGAGFAW